MKDKTGRVVLAGYLTAPSTGAAGSTIMTLPAGFRPPYSKRFVAYALVNSAASPQPVDVLASGAVVYQGVAASAVSLDGIVFDAGPAWAE